MAPVARRLSRQRSHYRIYSNLSELCAKVFASCQLCPELRWIGVVLVVILQEFVLRERVKRIRGLCSSTVDTPLPYRMASTISGVLWYNIGFLHGLLSW